MKNKFANIFPLFIFLILAIFFDKSLILARAAAIITLIFSVISLIKANTKKATQKVLVGIVLASILAGELSAGTICEHCARMNWEGASGEFHTRSYSFYFYIQFILIIILSLFNMSYLKASKGPF